MIWLIMVATGIFTFGTRFVMLNRFAERELPPWLVEALNFVPIAVLTAIIVPAVLIDPVSQSFSILDNPRLLAALIAVTVALITRQVITTIGAGLTTLWILEWLA